MVYGNDDKRQIIRGTLGVRRARMRCHQEDEPELNGDIAEQVKLKE